MYDTIIVGVLAFIAGVIVGRISKQIETQIIKKKMVSRYGKKKR